MFHFDFLLLYPKDIIYYIQNAMYRNLIVANVKNWTHHDMKRHTYKRIDQNQKSKVNTTDFLLK